MQLWELWGALIRRFRLLYGHYAVRYGISEETGIRVSASSMSRIALT